MAGGVSLLATCSDNEIRRELVIVFLIQKIRSKSSAPRGLKRAMPRSSAI